MSSDRKEENVKRKDYRRGGTEPVEEKIRKKRNRLKKLYRLEKYHDRFFFYPETKPHWSFSWGSYATLEDANKAMESKRGQVHGGTSWWRIVHKETGEVIKELDLRMRGD